MQLKTVAVGAKTYSIEVVASDPTLDTNADVDAYIDYQRTRIRVREASEHFMQENTVHEVLHALFENSGLHTEIDTERVIRVLAPRLHALFQHNPTFQRELLLK